MNPKRATIFSLLNAHDAQLVRIGPLAGRYPWFARAWDNFRLAAQRSHQINRDDGADESVDKGVWLPLMQGSKLATSDDRCISEQRPAQLDPARVADVRLIEVTATGKIGPTRLCLGEYERTRVSTTVKLLGLDLPGLVSARQRTMRLVQELVDQVEKALVDADSGAEAAALVANQMPTGGQISLLQRLTEPSQPYAAAARAQLRFLGYAELCVPIEQLGGTA